MTFSGKTNDELKDKSNINERKSHRITLTHVPENRNAVLVAKNKKLW